MTVFFIVIIIGLLGIALYLQHPKFGKFPTGKRLALMKKSPNYKNGRFQNVHFTPMISEGYSMSGVIYNFIFKKFPQTTPIDKIPSVKINLKNFPLADNILIWFGHSSYYIQLDKIRILVDPVFSGNASPLPYSNLSFAGTDIYSVEDMPEIDYLLITHDHYDHLDYPTIKELRPKIKNVLCGLGVGEHFEYWKYNPSIIDERDWNDTIVIKDNFTIHTTTARHFSGRSIMPNNTLWLSFILKTDDLKIYLGGDSGYDNHFKDIGKKFNGFDLAILENGQYNLAWEEIHMLPAQVIEAAKDLQTSRVLPVHSSKFKLAYHPWYEPLKTITAIHNSHDIKLATPMIGQILNLNDQQQTFKQWWKNLK